MIINDIRKNLAKVNNGSGIIIKSKNACYVLTAYHNIKESILYNEPVEIKNDKNIEIKVINNYYKPNKDIALLEVEYIKNTSIVKFDKNIQSNDEITFVGYPEKAKGERKRCSGYVDEWNDKTSIKVVENINPSFVEEERANEVIVGFSGSAVFKLNNNEISIIGLLRSLSEKDFYYNDINCISIKDILCFLDENNLSILKPLKIKRNTMTSKNKISNNSISSGNNSPVNIIGSAESINLTYASSQKEVSIDDAKKLFNSKKYNKAKDIFSDLMFDNDECKIFFIICSLSNKRISHINKYEIEDLYDLIEEITDENLYNISNYLWLIIFYEYTHAHSIPIKLDRQHKKRRSVSIGNRLKLEEKKLFKYVKLVNEKSSFL